MRDNLGRFIKGSTPYNYRKQLSDETKKKLSKSCIGRKHSKETKLKMSLSHKGKKYAPWSLERRLRWGQLQLGKKRKPHSEEAKRKIGLAHKGIIFSKESRNNIKLGHLGIKYPNRKSHSPSVEHRLKLSLALTGEKSYCWLGGKSFEPYPSLFNRQLKEKIRVRDNFICQICHVPELEFKNRLAIHHVDYDKNNCSEGNLISVCSSCHSKTQINREFWTSCLKLKIGENVKQDLFQKIRGGKL